MTNQKSKIFFDYNENSCFLSNRNLDPFESDGDTEDVGWCLQFNPCLKSVEEWNLFKSCYEAENYQIKSEKEDIVIKDNTSELTFFKYGIFTYISQRGCINSVSKEFSMQLTFENKHIIPILDDIINYVSKAKPKVITVNIEDILLELADK